MLCFNISTFRFAPQQQGFLFLHTNMTPADNKSILVSCNLQCKVTEEISFVMTLKGLRNVFVDHAKSMHALVVKLEFKLAWKHISNH